MAAVGGLLAFVIVRSTNLVLTDAVEKLGDGAEHVAVASGQVAQLNGHIPIGMNNGLTQAEIAEGLTHLTFYVGWPNVFSAMPVAKDVFEKRAR